MASNKRKIRVIREQARRKVGRRGSAAGRFWDSVVRGVDRVLAATGTSRPGGALFVLALACLTVAVAVVSCQGNGGTLAGRLQVNGEPPIRVRVRNRVTRVEIESARPVQVRALDGGAALAMTPPLVVTSGAKGIGIVDTAGVVREWGAGVDVEVEPGEKAALVVDGAPYPGLLTIRGRSRESGAFDLVSTLGMEAYVAGVLQKELYDRWPKEAYAAQAIAVRSYAMHEQDRARRSARPYDVESTTASQVFGGAATRELAVEAARNTRGKVLTYQGAGGSEVLRAYFSSTCGGRPGSAGMIWPTGAGFEFNAAGPLQGKTREFACQGTPTFAWEVVRKNDELSRRIRAWGKDVGKSVAKMERLKAVEVLSANSAGRPGVYRLVDVKGGEFRVTADELRVACNAGERPFTTGSAGGTDGRGASAAMAVVSGAGQVKSNDLEFVFNGDEVRIRGRGYGHGVGLCQFCAKGFAEKGMGAGEMLGLFYPGARVERVY